MADDDVDHELLALLRQKFGLGGPNSNGPPETKILRDAQFVVDNSIDVALSMQHTKIAARAVLEEMQKREYSTKTWTEHDLHPKVKDEATVNFIFTMDLLNFSFWSEKSEEERFAVSYKGKKWTGYWSLVAALQRALDEGIPITSPAFWVEEEEEEEAEGDRGTQSSQDVPPSWSDPKAPRLDNGAFDTGVYDDPPTGSQSGEAESATADPVEEENSELSLKTASTGDDGSSENDVFEDAQENHNEEHHDPEDAPCSEPEEEQAEEKQPVVKKRGWATEDVLKHVFRSETGEEIPMFQERVECLREAGRIIQEEFDGSVIALIEEAKGSAAGLVNLLADRFPCFLDETRFETKKVRFLKRAQIFVADLWAAFDGEGYGSFDDIDKITMFAGKFLLQSIQTIADLLDYRVPQILHSLGLVQYCPPLQARIGRGELLESGHPWEVQIRGCSIWAVELLRREMVKLQPDVKVNAILLDFFLYDLAKEKEKDGEEVLPHHRTRSIWY